METITIDGVDEHTFRHGVEDLLRVDQVDMALDQLREQLAPYAGPGKILPARFLEVTPGEVEITGWERLASRLANHDRPHFPITAIGVVLADARVLGGPGPQGGRLAPFIKTYYFSDDAYPFTNAGRDDLLDGYSREGFGWQGDYQATDATLAIKGIDDLHGAIIELEDRLFDSARPDEDQLRAGSIGACFLAALIHQALRETIRRQGLPRPLCVLAACDGIYPFFDAPVAGWDDGMIDAVAPAEASLADGGEETWPNELDEGAAGEQGSLLSIVSRKGTKAMALELGEDDVREAARFTADAGAQRLTMTDDMALRGLFHGVAAATLLAGDEPETDGDEAAAAGPGQSPPTDATAAPAAVPAAVPDALISAGADPARAIAPDLPAPDNDPAPASGPAPAATYAWADPREQFRRAEEAHAFPTGTSLRSRFKAEEVQSANPLLAMAGALANRARTRMTTLVARGRSGVSGQLAAGRDKSRQWSRGLAMRAGLVLVRTRRALAFAGLRAAVRQRARAILAARPRWRR
ncbi:hypothetical protein ACFOD9_14325 [Novosphingobium bradum]|uniref:Uncharacterized protein n=1 Tax=Novosphingobium bradum TaxID=1737444 RepID=A0ABV7IXT7_9SPHN